MNPNQNPLLADGELPAFSAIAADQILPAIETVLADYQSQVERLTADAGARSFDTLIAPLERMEERLGRSFAPVSHLHGVKDSPELREAYSAALERITEHGSVLGQNRALFEAVQAVRDSDGFSGLDRARQTLVEDKPARLPPGRRGLAGTGAHALPGNPEPAEQGADRIRGSSTRRHRCLDPPGARVRAGGLVRFGALHARPRGPGKAARGLDGDAEGAGRAGHPDLRRRPRLARDDLHRLQHPRLRPGAARARARQQRAHRRDPRAAP